MTKNATVAYYPGWPVIGHLLELRDQRIPFLVRVASRYPELVRVRIGISDVIVVSSHDLVHQLLVEQHDACRMNYALALFAEPFLGNGMLRLPREAHRKRRRLVSPAFVPRRISGYADEMIARAERAADRMLRLGQCDVADECMRVTFDIVGKTLFDAEVAGDAEEVGKALTDVMRCIVDSITRLIPVPVVVPTPTNLRMRRAVKRLDRLVYRMIRERRASTEDRGDVLSILLSARDPDDGSTLSDRDVRDEAMTMYLAGHETTANTLAWALFFLAQNRAAYERLEAEVDAVAGSRSLQPSDVPYLPWTLQVIKESLRLRPPVYAFARSTERAIQLGGHHIAANSVIAVNIIGMQRRADLFPDPERFDPERFEASRERALPRHAFLPFSVGPRSCMGNHFALLEAQLVLATWVRRIRFSLLSATPPGFDALLTLRPLGGIPMAITPRRTQPAAQAVPRGQSLD